ncbi:hypothetical protein [Bradyrhizobium elkanii]|uniref:hypothetical protein n=1 Tax=Bradyrhizobium elkanii TaxID=29448 RepID=UPI001FCA853A|nr:hypothetical protein [Bradyrhizobium elkanii]WLA85745.1 hypothetical protein QNJ99_16890 [Bradyrhizobium elkanii]
MRDPIAGLISQVVVTMEFIGRPMRGRFLVRQGGNGWMVYDSELKGPAQIEKNGAFAENLTKEHAEILAERLALERHLKNGPSVRGER